jgi:phage antirepressor YoqD-like protein
MPAGLYTLRDASKRLNVGNRRLIRLIDDLKIKTTRFGCARVLVEDDLRKIKDALDREDSGITLSEAAAQLQIWPRTLSRTLKRLKVETKRIGRSRILTAEQFEAVREHYRKK